MADLDSSASLLRSSGLARRTSGRFLDYYHLRKPCRSLSMDQYRTRFPGVLRNRIQPTVHLLPEAFILDPCLDGRCLPSFPIARRPGLLGLQSCSPRPHRVQRRRILHQSKARTSVDSGHAVHLSSEGSYQTQRQAHQIYPVPLHGKDHQAPPVSDDLSNFLGILTLRISLRYYYGYHNIGFRLSSEERFEEIHELLGLIK